MKALKLSLLIMGLALFQTVWSNPASDKSPVPMLEETAKRIISTLKENKANLKSHPEIIHKAIQVHLVPHVDVAGMSRSVLGRQVWSKASQTERAQFAEEFTHLVIRTYAGPLAEYTDETMQFIPVRGSLDSRFLRLNSLIVRSSGQTIRVTYSLVAKDSEWKIYDFSVEGVSLLQSFKTQFAQALQNTSIHEVIHKMKEKQAHKVAKSEQH